MPAKRSAGKGKPGIHLICALIALLCVAVMFVPAGRERGHGNQYGEVLFLGEAQFSISHAYSGFDSDRPEYKIDTFALIIASALLIGWAVQSFRGQSGRLGLIAGIVNLLASAVVLLTMTVENGAYLLIVPTVILIALLAAVAIVLAVKQRRA